MIAFDHEVEIKQQTLKSYMIDNWHLKQDETFEKNRRTNPFYKWKHIENKNIEEHASTKYQTRSFQVSMLTAYLKNIRIPKHTHTNSHTQKHKQTHTHTHTQTHNKYTENTMVLTPSTQFLVKTWL